LPVDLRVLLRREHNMALQDTVAVKARPGPFDLDVTHAAVIVVDMQNDFGAPGGMFARAGIDISPIRAAVAPTASVLDAARQGGLPVVFLKMGFRPDLSDLGPDHATNRQRHVFLGVGETVDAPDGRSSRVLVRDTWNTEIVDELEPAPEDYIVYKHRFSGFFQTELEDVLRGLGVRDLIFTGCTTSICVESTIRDAMFRDFRCLLLEDCTAEPIGAAAGRTNHEASLLVIETLFGWVATSTALVDAFTCAAQAHLRHAANA
jgi:ureidoacrylate peracid hydrolase